MEIELPYGNHTQCLNTDNFNKALSIGGRFACKFPSPLSHKEIDSRLKKSFKHFADSTDSKLLTIVNDGYRRTPTAKIFDSIWEYIKRGEFIVATGTHRRPTEMELEEIFGSFYEAVKPRLHIHDCYKSDELVEIGATSRGTQIKLNRKAIDAEYILTINSVEPHFFAGYTGGRKSLIPGLAGFETVMTNHALAKDPNAATLNLDTNPLNLDLEEGISLVKDRPIKTVQCVTDTKGELIDIFVGDLREAFLKACVAAKDYFSIEVPHNFDIVIANCEPPLDSNLYQLQKAQEHGGRMVKKGGVLIVMGACYEGTGSKYFMELAAKYPTPESVLSKGIKDSSFGIHKLVKTARQLQNFRVFYVTTLDDAEVRRVYLKSFKDINKAVEEALKILDNEIEIGILEDAGYSVPVVKR